MADEQPKNRMGDLKKIVLTALFSGVLSAIIVTIITYYVNEYLTKDNIRIESVDFIPETKYLYLSQSDYGILVRLRDRVSSNFSSIDFRFINLLNKVVYGEVELDALEGLKKHSGLNKSEVDSFIELIYNFINLKKNANERFDIYIKRLENYKDGDNIADIVSATHYLVSFKINPDDPLRAVPILLEHYKEVKKLNTTEDSNISHLLNVLNNFKPVRTGSMKIHIAFLNLGNTDGLVSKTGVLNLINERKQVKIRMTNTNAIPKVEKRSMTQVIFEVDKDQSEPESISVLDTILKNYSSGLARIELIDILKQLMIRSENFPLPIRRDTE